MRRLVFGFLLTVTLAAITSVAAGYKVTKVIEVGPAVPVQAGGSVKWSPDGTMLAYFANNYLMVSDTLGNSRKVAAIADDAYPVRAEWASPTEFAVCLKGKKRSDSTLYQLVAFEIESGQSRLVDRFWRHRWSLMPGDVSFEGPYRTLEGNAYYVKVHTEGDAGGDLVSRRASRRFNRVKLPVSAAKSVDLHQDHLTRWDADSAYRVSWSNSDSDRRYVDRVHSPLHPESALSPSGAVEFRRGLLIDRTTRDTIDVREYAGDIPSNTLYCGFLRPVFNPAAPEVLFQYYCEGKDPYVVDRVGTFNYETREFVLLDDIAAAGVWQLPEYSPDGRMIAFTSGHKAYIVWREEAQ